MRDHGLVIGFYRRLTVTDYQKAFLGMGYAFAIFFTVLVGKLFCSKTLSTKKTRFTLYDSSDTLTVGQIMQTKKKHFDFCHQDMAIDSSTDNLEGHVIFGKWVYSE